MDPCARVPVSACDRLGNAGARIDRFEHPALSEAFAMAGPLYTADAWAWWRDRIMADPDRMFPQILERVRAGAEVNAADYLAHWMRLRELRTAWAAATAPYDAVILPTAPILPPQVDRLMTDDAYYKAQNLAALRNTRVANLMGTCAITLPTGVPSTGLMLMGRAGDEERLLRIAAAAEEALS